MNMTKLPMKQLSELLSEEGLEKMNNFNELFQLYDDESNESNACSSSEEGREKAKIHRVIDKRNARERRRVENVNDAFKRLRSRIPYENKDKRLSKVKTLQTAMRYINYLADMLNSSTYVNNKTTRLLSARPNKMPITFDTSFNQSFDWSTNHFRTSLSGRGLDTGHVISQHLCNVSRCSVKPNFSGHPRYQYI